MKQRAQHKGFTLIEIMVVVVILATMSAISILAIQQATRRPFFSEAEQLQAWLQQLSELAALDGTAYGVRRVEQSLHGLVFYRQHWFPLSEPEPFELSQQAILFLAEEEMRDSSGSDENDLEVEGISNDSAFTEESFVPSLILAEGWMEPAEELRLYFANEDITFSYHWNESASALLLGSELQEGSEE